MPSDQIQWFPGHMAKTRRIIREVLPKIDLVIELLDARIPFSSHNPELRMIIADKPLMTVMTKASLADPSMTAAWKRHFASQGVTCLPIDCVSGEGVSRLPEAVKEALGDKLAKYESKGMSGRRVKVMIVGIPNVGKSSLINRLAGSGRAKVENRPGVTRQNQWITTKMGIDLLDTPGTLWPKFDSRMVGEHLAITGAIKDEVVQIETLAMALVGRLRARYPELLAARYKLGDMAQYAEYSDYELLCAIGKKRGFLISGGEINTERTADMLLDELRDGKIGRITLETPLPPRREEKPPAQSEERSDAPEEVGQAEERHENTAQAEEENT